MGWQNDLSHTVETGFEMRRKIFPPLVFLPVLWYAGIRQKTTGVDTMAKQEMLLDTATIKPPSLVRSGPKIK